MTAKADVAVQSMVTPGGVHHKTQLYMLDAHKSDTFSEKIFTGDTKTSHVCRLMADTTGRFDAGCEEAAAFTSWSIRVPPGWGLYDAGTGAKDEGATHLVTVQVNTTLPAHKPRGAVPHRDALDIKRFLAALAVHERGHGSMGEQVLRNWRATCAAMPASIPVPLVPAVNLALENYLLNVLQPGARAADVLYDADTGHGLTQGAQSGAMDEPGPLHGFGGALAMGGKLKTPSSLSHVQTGPGPDPDPDPDPESDTDTDSDVRTDKDTYEDTDEDLFDFDDNDDNDDNDDDDETPAFLRGITPA